MAHVKEILPGAPVVDSNGEDPMYSDFFAVFAFLGYPLPSG